MTFIGLDGPGSELVVSGDVFLRAIGADALLDLQQALQVDVTAIVDSELEYLAAQRRMRGVGGWSYFPDFPALAPDADDLAEMIRLFARRGDMDALQRYCAPPLAVLLDECSHADGTFETWIIPAANHTAEEALQHWAAQAMWGTGADAAVVANLLHALTVAAPYGVFGATERARALGHQYLAGWVMRGDYRSTWYVGLFYPAYAAARCLAAAGTPQLDEVVAFLTRTQYADGGWGNGPARDVLSTALGLMAAIFAGAPDALIDAATGALIDQVETAPLASTPFIQMDTGSAVAQYGSATMTMHFVAKAVALACRRTTAA